jgi:hypothetical protein
MPDLIRGLTRVFASVALLCVALVSIQATSAGAQGAQATWLEGPGTGNGYSDSVSCVSPTFCAAVGGNYASVYDGTGWTLSADIDPNISADQGTNLSSVSCPSTTFCAAVDDQGNALTYNGTAWSAPVDLNGGDDSYLSAVSCPSVTFCLAVGTTFSAAGESSATFSYDGPSWSSLSGALPDGRGMSCVSASFCVVAGLAGEASFYPPGSGSAGTIDSDPEDQPQSVSCVTTTFCVAVLDSGIASIYNGSSWAPSDIDGAIELHSVSCASVTFCVAVDDQGNALTFDGTSWSDPTHIDGSGEAESVSCPSTTFCVAVSDGGAVGIYSTAPSTTVTAPSPGGNLSGTNASLEATASGSNEATIANVDFVLTGGSLSQAPIGTATTTESGYLASFNTTDYPDGAYTLQSMATDSRGFTAYSAGIQITIDNPPPSTSVLVPASGATISGTQAALDASASPSDGGPIASVQFALTGGSYNQTVIGTATPTLYGYIEAFNTTMVPNGTYTLQSLATDRVGNISYSSGIPITVDNASPSSTAVTIPSNNASVSGTSQVLDATASPGVTKVQYELTGGTLTDSVIATATPTLYGWLASWNTTTVPNGAYSLQSVATEGSNTAASTPLSITVANPTPSTSVLIPANGASISGTSAVLDASASPGYSTVTFELSGGTLSDQVIATGTATLYGSVAPWNTTTVPNGTYTLISVAAYPNGVNTESAPVSITVNNPPPSTTVVYAESGATYSPLVLDAVASPGVTSVVFDMSVDGGTGSSVTATPTIHGWIATFPPYDGGSPACDFLFTVSIQSVASYSGGVSGTSAPVNAGYWIDLPSECSV